MKICLNINLAGLLFVLHCYRHIVQGTVTISPPGTALVCNGDQLELICDITGMLLKWNISQIDETGTARQFVRRSITADGPATVQTFPIEYNSTTFTFSRISTQGSPILTSRVVIDKVKDSLNGTVVTCVDVTSLDMESSSTTIMIINSQIQSTHSELNISERFERQRAIVTLEWTQRDPQALHSYYVSVIPQAELILNLNETSSIMMNMSYNVAYNLTILIRGNRCMENLTFISRAFYYPYCQDPALQIEDTINVFGYNMEAVIPGSIVTFSCSLPGYTLIGSNTSICMSNGEWDPDPRKANECKANCGPPSPPPNCHVSEIHTNTLEGAEVMFLCRSTFQFGQQSLCKEMNITTVCNQEGIWEPIADDINMCTGPSGHFLSQGGIISMASSVCVFMVTSILFSTFGYLCGHYRQKQEQNNPLSTSAIKPAPIYENIQIKDQTEILDLETNLAYAQAQVQ